MNNKANNKKGKRKTDKSKLAIRIACGVLAAIMVFGVAYTVIAVLI